MPDWHSQLKWDSLREELQVVEAILRLTLDQEERQTEDPKKDGKRRPDNVKPSAVFVGLERPDPPHWEPQRKEDVRRILDQTLRRAGQDIHDDAGYSQLQGILVPIRPNRWRRCSLLIDLFDSISEIIVLYIDSIVDEWRKKQRRTQASE